MRDELQEVRIDKWLWAARFFKTRSLATQAVDGGKVEVNDLPVKPSRAVKIGDRVRVRIGAFEHRLVVTGLGERRGSAEAAAGLYEEAPESIAARERLREMHRMAPGPIYEEKGRPQKKDRRQFERWRGRD